MAIRLGDTAPNFQAETTEGPIDFYEHIGDGWAVLFSHPKDFTPVCTTELGEVARLKPEFDKRNVKVIGLSVDPVGSHREWAKDIAETQKAELNFPVIADADKQVSSLYDMIHPAASDSFTGRNFQELLRVIDSLQLTAKHQVATPANWKQGEEVIIVPSLSDEEAKKKFPGGWKALKPYLRLVPQPK